MSPFRAPYLSALAVCLILAGAGHAKPTSESSKSAATPAGSQTVPPGRSQESLPPNARDSEARRANREDSLAAVWSVLLQHERQLAPCRSGDRKTTRARSGWCSR